MAGRKKRKQRPSQQLSLIVLSETATLNEELPLSPRQTLPLDETFSIMEEARIVPYFE